MIPGLVEARLGEVKQQPTTALTWPFPQPRQTTIDLDEVEPDAGRKIV